DLDTFRAYVLTHNLMHGCAMADGLGLPSPFEPGHAALVWPFLCHALPLMLHEDAGLEGTIALEVEGCFSAALVLEDGTARVEDAAPGPVDCHLSADPLTFFRVVLRMDAVDDAVRRGALRLSGPRPELGAQLSDHLEVP
ncbi:MAG: SCP2 sterol-binding domain-containing protein, partial [Actinomycetota bacterium]